jgi:hypothetical protein
MVMTYKVFTTGLRSSPHIWVTEICKVCVVLVNLSASYIVQAFYLCSSICSGQLVKEIIQLKLPDVNISDGSITWRSWIRVVTHVWIHFNRENVP